jgi:hypothetical protein
MQPNYCPLRSRPPEWILHASLQRVPRPRPRRRVSTLTGYLSTVSFFADLYHSRVCLPGTVRGTLEGHLSSSCTVVFSPDGQLVAFGSSDNTIRLWDARTGAARGTLKGHSSSVWTVAFSPDGQLVASGSDDKTVRLWDMRTGTVRGTLKGHSSSAVVLPLSPSDILNTRRTGKQRLRNQCLSRPGLSNSRISVPYCQIRETLELARRLADVTRCPLSFRASQPQQPFSFDRQQKVGGKNPRTGVGLRNTLQ